MLRHSVYILPQLRLAAVQTSHQQVCAIGTSFVCESTASRQSQAEDESNQTITAVPRDRAGTTAVKQLRREGKTPGIVFSLPGNGRELVALDSKDLGTQIRIHGRRGFLSKVFTLQVDAEGDSSVQGAASYRVLPRQVHYNAASGEVENVTFMHCPERRRVRVPIPLEVFGEELSPGIKRGGFVSLLQRRVDCWCPGEAIPSNITIDVSGLELGEKVRFAELPVPEGVEVITADPKLPVCKIAGRASREAATA